MISASLASGVAKAFMLVQMGACPMAPPPRVTMQLHANKPQYIDSLTVPELTKRFSNSTSYNTFSFTDMKIAGLTDAHIGRSYKIIPSVMRDGDEACLGVKEVIVEIFYSAEIYIPAEYPRDSCGYGMTLKHEHGHVETALRTFLEYKPRFQSEIKQAVEGLGPLGPYVDAPEVLDDQVSALNDQIGDTVQAVFAEMIEANQQRQYAIDDPKALEAAWNECR